MDTQVTVKVPSSEGIIGIHTSDRALFKRCRRKWDWASPARRNLTPDIQYANINFALWFGTGIHFALECFYTPGFQHDPVESWITYYAITYEGGQVSDRYLRLTYDPKPQQKVASSDEGTNFYTYQTRGLCDLLSDPNVEEFEAHKQLGIGMMQFYKEYAEREDRFTVVAPEHEFSVPIYDPNGNVLMHQGKEVHYRGKQDGIILDQETERYGILETKTAVKIDEEYHRKLEKDEQVTSYLWAAEQEAALHGLEYKEMDYVLYNALRKAFPRSPTQLKSGLPSINRQEESTTYDLFLEYVKKYNLEVWFQDNEKAQAYAHYLREIGDGQFIQRNKVRRNRAEIESAGERIFMETMDMLDNPRIYPNVTNDWPCLNCEFRAPCIMADDGSNAELYLEDYYVKNERR